jgi:hypothetical protein
LWLLLWPPSIHTYHTTISSLITKGAIKFMEHTSGNVEFRGDRSYLEGPYHFCARCGSRVHIEEMEWQQGLLLCKKYDCVDHGIYPLIGQREAAIAHALEVPSQELMPNDKLLYPQTSGESYDDDIIF